MALRIVPLTQKAANKLIVAWHRHHKPPQGGLFAIGVSDGNDIVGAVIVGRPVARLLNDGSTCEVTRCVTNGARNACSMLYRAAWRTAQGMGYERLITYTLPEEGGASLRGAGFTRVGIAGGGKWSRSSRPRADDHPTQPKVKWELTK